MFLMGSFIETIRIFNSDIIKSIKYRAPGGSSISIIIKFLNLLSVPKCPGYDRTNKISVRNFNFIIPSDILNYSFGDMYSLLDYYRRGRVRLWIAQRSKLYEKPLCSSNLLPVSYKQSRKLRILLVCTRLV